MLAPNFKTAEELGIMMDQHAALVRTLRAFETGEIPADEFDMGVWSRRTILHGKACCIGGWAQILVGEYLFDAAPLPAGLDALFFPDRPAIVCTDVRKGASALRNYLTTGNADWDDVMAGKYD